MTTVQSNKKIFVAFTIALSFSTIASLRADAAIVTVNNSGSWIKDDTIANQGFALIPVPNGAEAIGTDLSALSFPLGNIEFSGSVNKRQIGNGWQTWSNNYKGEVYYSGQDVLTLDIKLPNLNAFDFYVQPDFQRLATISATAQSGKLIEMLSQQVDGAGGAQYFGFYSNDPIQSIQITGDKASGGFAIAQLRGARTAVVPTPLLLPGMIGLGFGLWRKARNKQRAN